MDHVIMEVYSICVYIKRRDGQKGGQVYGRIRCEDGGGDLDLFKVEKDDAKSIDSDGILSLTTPHRCVKGYNLEVYFTLKEKDHDLEVSHGYVAFKDLDRLGLFDKRGCYLVHGMDGCAMLHLSFLRPAVQAVVEIAFKSGHEQGTSASSPRIFGTIFAENSKFEFNDWYSRRYYRVALFEAQQNKPHNLEAGNQQLALSRNAVGVSKKKSLKIEARLFRISASLGVVGSTPPPELVHGSVTFRARTSGTVSQDIVGPNGCIEVKVTWSELPVGFC